MARLVEGGGWWRTSLVRSALLQCLPTQTEALPHRSLSTYAGATCYSLVNPFTSQTTKLAFPRWYTVSLVIPPGFGSAAFVLTGAVGTQPYVTTLGLDLRDYGGDYSAAAYDAFFSYATHIMAETSNQLTLDRVTLSVGADGPGGSVDSTNAPVAGSKSGQFPPTACSLIARKSTNVLGRRGRGRMFIPGVLGEADIDQDGTVQAGKRTSLNTVLNAFYLELRVGSGGTPMPPVLLHGPAAVPLPPTEISGLTCSDLVGWIRGRIR